MTAKTENTPTTRSAKQTSLSKSTPVAASPVSTSKGNKKKNRDAVISPATIIEETTEECDESADQSAIKF